MKYLIAYDVSDDKRRRKLFKLLKGYGYNIQKSVFEVPVNDQKIIKKLKDEIEKIVEKEHDLVYIFPYYKEPITNKEYKDFFQRGYSF